MLGMELSHRQTDFLIGLKSAGRSEKNQIRRRQRVVAGENDPPVVQPSLVGCVWGPAESEVPLEEVFRQRVEQEVGWGVGQQLFPLFVYSAQVESGA